MEVTRKIINIVLFAVLIVMFVAIFGLQENTTYENKDYTVNLSEGWIFADSENSDIAVEFPYKFPKDNNQVKITRKLPKVSDHTILLVKCNYHSLVAYVDGEEIYHSFPATFGLMETDLGHYAAMIPLDSTLSEKDITLVVEQRESGHNSDIKYIHLSTIGRYGFQQLTEKIGSLIIALIMIFISTASLVVWIVFRLKKDAVPEKIYHPLLWISVFSASIGGWVASMPHLLAIATGTFASSGIINYLSLSLLPVSFLSIINSLCVKKLPSLDFIVMLFKVVLIGEWILFLTGIVDFSTMLTSLQAAIVVSLLIFCYYVLFKGSYFNFGKAIRYGMYAVSVLAVITIVSYFLNTDWMPLAILAITVILVSVIVGILIDINNVIKQLKQTKSYKEFALKDIMTGMKSRYAYTIFEDEYVGNDLPINFCLIYMDINKLKETNDTLGHSAGDELVIGTSHCIIKAFGDDVECFRMGGDEFLIALTADSDEIKEKLLCFDQALSQWHGVYTQDISVSWGVASTEDHPELSFLELLRLADQKMYQKKKSKRELKCENL